MDIYINVYNMHPINSYIQYVGVGAYHSAISVGDIEISFSKKKGIYYTKKNNTQEFLKDSIFIDTSYLHDFEIYNKINSFDYLFNASSYDIITNNCNHFTKTIVDKIFFKEAPSYINRLADFLFCFTCLLPYDFIMSAQRNTVPEEQEIKLPLLIEELEQDFFF